ncbi:Gfo/Idh/MocA family oxidoreductase [Amnibacterium sp. CER49]|uniref:Gfo/Idh/MocA family protein n=1 Tax=Amnibacterium sp. CER49 TaxID=3039161 RepID=UPI002449ACC7|nr:Gfo/Idh/MocA family oxidoreductase [Amnibacterium sp. CER49]MDH2443391.1 Gfo/Idh/MocA family oxidoreductase [Amnibacterium sp. CER49]
MSGTGPVGVGVIGAGVISNQYLQNLVTFPDVRVVFVADIDVERARAQAETFGIPGAGTVPELLASDDVEIVVNLTIPAAHAEVAHSALDAGKHVWNEKPLTVNRDEADALLAHAREAGLRVACAPDTVLGAGIQTALRAIRDGRIGTPTTAATMMLSPGPESWHPNPAFLFAKGGGPLLDMGPYYLTTLVSAFGPVGAVAAAASTAFSTRTIGSGPLAGTDFPVEVPTHYGVLLRFENGTSAQSTFSFQSALPRQGFVEITGTEGVLVLPDPNRFDGPTTLYARGAEQPETLVESGSAAGRGTGVVDLARAIRAGVPERASGELAAHVLDVMLSVTDAAETDAFVPIRSRVAQPEPLPEGWDPAQQTL